MYLSPALPKSECSRLRLHGAQARGQWPLREYGDGWAEQVRKALRIAVLQVARGCGWLRCAGALDDCAHRRLHAPLWRVLT